MPFCKLRGDLGIVVVVEENIDCNSGGRKLSCPWAMVRVSRGRSTGS
jgi:hypothetical protein